jgi:hypothetical protein
LGGLGAAALGNYRDCTVWWTNDGWPIQRDERAIARAIERGETTLCEIVQVQCPDKTKKTVLNSAVPLLNQGQITGAVNIMQDISGQHHVQAELAKSPSKLPK